jgi:hypothetical protein
MLSLTSSSNLNNGLQRESLFCDSAYAMMLDMMLDVGLARTALAARVALQMAALQTERALECAFD